MMTKPPFLALILTMALSPSIGAALDGDMAVEVAPATEDEDRPLRIEITEGIISPITIAITPFHDEGGAAGLVADITKVISDDLTETGLFRAIPEMAQLEKRESFNAPIHWPSWRAVHAEALVTGAVSQSGVSAQESDPNDIPPDGHRITVKFRLHDVTTGEPLGSGIKLDGTDADWRRLAHKVADQIYMRLTGEGAYLDSAIVFVAESGPKGARVKQLAIMDQDGANMRMLTDGRDLVLSPKLAPDGRRVLFTSFANGLPQIAVLALETGRTQILQSRPDIMSFAASWSPDGRWIAYSQEEAGITNLWLMDVASGAARPLTRGTSIDTAPSFAPDGRQIVFESDRSGRPQLYILSLDENGTGGGTPKPRRISFGDGHYSTPAWSPRGDLIAFTKRSTPADKEGEYHIGTMHPDGSAERLLTSSVLDEGPSWSPNGRVILFTHQAAGDGQADDGDNGNPATEKPRLHAIDVTGRNLRAIKMQEAASDPDWGPLRP